MIAPKYGEGEKVDLDQLVPKVYGERFTNRDFIFSESLTEKTPLEEELEDLETYKQESRGALALQTLATTGGAAGLVYLSVKGLTNVEAWIKDQERKDMEEEIELTGGYISVDASDVDSAIDPTSGKNFTITRAAGAKGDKKVDKDAEPTQAPWFLRVLGLGDSVAADDDAFWAPATAPSQGTPGSKSKADDKDGGVDGGEGGSGGAPEDGDDDDGDDDDSSGIDTLDDLMG